MNRILRYIHKIDSDSEKNQVSDSDDDNDSIHSSENSFYEEENILLNYLDIDYENSGNEYKFNDDWNIWYHHLKNNWKIEGFNKIFKITSIKEFWDFNNNINLLGGINSHHFFMMKNDITPIWEDINNKNGGCWSIKIPTEKSIELWIKLSAYIVGNNLVEDKDLINGISICAKNPITSVVKIWNNDTKKNSIKLLPVDILNEYGFNIIYKSHIPEY